MAAVKVWRPVNELRLLEFMDNMALSLLRSKYPIFLRMPTRRC